LFKKFDLITEKTLIPGDPGTKKWMKAYGDRLLRIRYRYDRNTKKKIKTVELIVEEKSYRNKKTGIPGNKIVHVKIKYGEIHMARLVKAAGGKWNREKKFWEIKYGEVKALGLTHRIIR